MDNIAIAMRTTNTDHTTAMRNVLSLTTKHNLYFKPEKCIFHAPHINYLGVILEKRVTHMDPVKIVAIKDWLKPDKVKDICSFLGFCNFYHAFIKGFASIAKPLNALTCKDTIWQWTGKHQKAFEILKTQVSCEPILAHLELDKQFECAP